MEQPQRPRPMGLPTGTDPQAIRQRIEAMERLLERGFTIPGINRPVGLDAIAGLALQREVLRHHRGRGGGHKPLVSQPGRRESPLEDG